MSDQAEKTRAILRKVRQVEIRSRRFVDNAMVGAYHSVFKGAGIDFAEVREYQPGDDVRSIDWNVTAKMDRPFLKVYEEERELSIMLVVDVSGSIAYARTLEVFSDFQLGGRSGVAGGVSEAFEPGFPPPDQACGWFFAGKSGIRA